MNCFLGFIVGGWFILFVKCKVDFDNEIYLKGIKIGYLGSFLIIEIVICNLWLWF